MWSVLAIPFSGWGGSLSDRWIVLFSISLTLSVEVKKLVNHKYLIGFNSYNPISCSYFSDAYSMSNLTDVIPSRSTHMIMCTSIRSTCMSRLGLILISSSKILTKNIDLLKSALLCLFIQSATWKKINQPQAESHLLESLINSTLSLWW